MKNLKVILSTFILSLSFSSVIAQAGPRFEFIEHKAFVSHKTFAALLINNEFLKYFTRTEFASGDEYVQYLDSKYDEVARSLYRQFRDVGGESMFPKPEQLKVYETLLRYDAAYLDFFVRQSEQMKTVPWTPEASKKILSASTYSLSSIHDSSPALFGSSLEFQQAMLPYFLSTTHNIEEFSTVIGYPVAPAAEFEWFKRDLMNPYVVRGFVTEGADWLQKLADNHVIKRSAVEESIATFLLKAFPHGTYTDEQVINKALIYILTLQDDIEDSVIPREMGRQSFLAGLTKMEATGKSGDNEESEKRLSLNDIYTPEIKKFIKNRSDAYRKVLLQFLEVKFSYGATISVSPEVTRDLIKKSLDSGYRLIFKESAGGKDQLVAIQDMQSSRRAYVSLAKDVLMRLAFPSRVRTCGLILTGIGRGQ